MSTHSEEEDWTDLPLFAPEGITIPSETTEDDASAVGALSHLIYDEETPEEASELLREKGNQAFMLGTRGYKRAIDLYTESIAAAKGSPVALTSYLNRANAQARLGNAGYALADGKKALEIDEKNIKALYRCASCSKQLRRFEECVMYCNKAMEQGEYGMFQDMGKAAAQMVEREKRRDNEVKAYDEKVQNMLTERGIRIGAPLFEMQRRYEITGPRWEEGWIWPLMIVYIGEDIERSDYVRGVEENVTMEDILLTILSGSVEWDHNGFYANTGNIELRFRKDWTVLDGGGDVVGSDVCEPGKWVTVGNQSSLLELMMMKDYITPMFPVLYAVPKAWKG